MAGRISSGVIQVASHAAIGRESGKYPNLKRLAAVGQFHFVLARVAKCGSLMILGFSYLDVEAGSDTPTSLAPEVNWLWPAE